MTGDSKHFERIHDDINHFWDEPVLGFWDKLGHTRCLDCPPSVSLHYVLIEAGNSASDGMACDYCGAVLHDQRGVLARVAEAIVADQEVA